MELILKRIAKKKDYTIGKLYESPYLTSPHWGRDSEAQQVTTTNKDNGAANTSPSGGGEDRDGALASPSGGSGRRPIGGDLP